MPVFPLNLRPLVPLCGALVLAMFFRGQTASAAAGDAATLAPASAAAKPAGATDSSANGRGDEEFHIPEIFSSHLPGTMAPYTFRGWIHPHVGDFENRDFLRVSTGVRYGVTPKLEAGVGTDTYFSHGFGDVKAFDKIGFANVRVNGKLAIGESLLHGWHSAVGLDVLQPVGNPPAEITDGLRHTTGYVSFSRRLVDHPAVRVFWSVGGDYVVKTGVVGELRKNEFGDNAAMLTGGAVYDRGRFHYTFEATAATTRLVGHGDHDSFTVRPGLIWEIPTRKREGAKRSVWLVGAALRTTVGPDGTDFGASLKLRLNLNLKSWFGRE